MPSQTQFPIIIGIAGMSGEGNSQVAETLIRHSRICFCHHFLRSERLCFQIFSGKNKFTYLRNILQCVRVCVVVGRPAQWFLRLVVFVLFPAFHIPLPQTPVSQGKASVHTCAGRSYHSLYSCADTFFSCA